MRSRAAVLWNKMVDGLTVKKILLILLGLQILLEHLGVL